MATLVRLTDHGTAGLQRAQDAAYQALVSALPQMAHERLVAIRNFIGREGHVGAQHAQVLYLTGEILAGRVSEAQQTAWLAGQAGVPSTPASASDLADMQALLARTRKDWCHKECAVLQMFAVKPTNAEKRALLHMLASMDVRALDVQVRAVYRPSTDSRLSAMGIDKGGWAHPVGWLGTFRANELFPVIPSMTPPPAVEDEDDIFSLLGTDNDKE